MKDSVFDLRLPWSSKEQDKDFRRENLLVCFDQADTAQEEKDGVTFDRGGCARFERLIREKENEDSKKAVYKLYT